MRPRDVNMVLSLRCLTGDPHVVGKREPCEADAPPADREKQAMDEENGPFIRNA